MKFKILFPSGYRITDVLNDNIDINIVLENEDVFFGTLFTVSNINYLMSKESGITFFWATDMVIVTNLEIKTIHEAISQLISSGNFDQAFSKIGDVKSVYSQDLNFEKIESGYSNETKSNDNA